MSNVILSVHQLVLFIIYIIVFKLCFFTHLKKQLNQLILYELYKKMY